ncbi:ASKHA domain-containing protein [Blautia sp. HCP3S3_D9]|uniref:ASKHA domain-containing protein n=1 Tax=unclassified Blautia TaxID=2648079 RepID=UPI00262B7C33|nr:ASKHA domain-containing protein [Blautia sp.]MDD6414951.1 ASKHA domain-containing protein [Blautia sp.]MDY4115458.1 ASKHA domain-containing protein [Blautia sp.]
MAWVKFVRENIEIEMEDGASVLEAEIRAGLRPDAPCGGLGKCGKCLVKINGEVVKACQVRISEGETCVVETLDRAGSEKILTDGFNREVVFEPGLRMVQVKLEKARPGEKRSDWQRLLDELAEMDSDVEPERMEVDLKLAGELYGMRRDSDDWYVIYSGRRILEMRKQAGRRCLAAFDIGTTTIAGYLLDSEDGRMLAVESRMNPQAQYGADVIMRANYALEHGTDVLSRCIREAVNEMLGVLAGDAGISREDIFQVCIVGNTCMHHLFLGISPASLVHAPYTPAVSERLVLNAGDYGLDVQRKAELIMLPDIAGYVGADTCGCLLALRQDQKDEISLMIDIGTNGEMVLGNRNRLVTCSTAAGPAFEGAKIECGMRGAAGAVDHVKYENGKWDYTTVGNQPAVGLCGSGLIDLVAGLLDAGMLDENGALSSGQEKQGVFMLVPLEQAGNERGVYLTQKDIGEVQLAKAAIAAGIQMLMKRLGITEEEICSVYIAGAFGNYMDPVSAGKIGLLPAALVKKVKPVGNAAGEGAKIALVNEREMLEMDELVGKIDFVELAASGDFQDYFIDELGFEANE